MELISNAELALLSLIKERPLHAYEIEQVIEERNIRSWTEVGFSSIYRILAKLETSGFVEGQLQPPEGRGPARKVFHITPSGDTAWKQAAINNLSHPTHQYTSFLLGLDNLSQLPRDEALQSVQEYLAGQLSLYRQLTEMVAAHPQKDNFYIGIFFDYLMHQLTAEIKWLKTCCTKLEEFYQNN